MYCSFDKCEILIKTLIVIYIFQLFFFNNLTAIFTPKYIISTPLMIENPVNSPMVPPIADNLSSKFAFSSFVIRSNVGVPK
jgi:hypothetical protein